MDKCKDAVKEYHQFIDLGISRNVILQFIIHSLVSKFNYGAFIDPASQKHKYDEIDQIIARLVSKVFNTSINFTPKEWIEFCAAPSKAGGLALFYLATTFS